ncbi:MAG: sugar phosphate isomerase/epimerase family protein [Verrucomicrobiales bacterium]
MILTGIGDEAGNAIEAQIKATTELGWQHIELRNVEVGDEPVRNVHDLSDRAFDVLCARLDEAGIGVAGFGSVIGNWAHDIEDDFAITKAEIARAIPKMQRLDTKIVRIMSYKPRLNADGSDAPDQMEQERFRRLREIKARFDDAGIISVHENCMNYGGMSVTNARRLLENVPGLKWVFDTGNPCFNEDRDRRGQRQDSWLFYQAVKAHIAHVHVKDGIWNPSRKDLDYTMPGEGDGQVPRIMEDLLRSGYRGFVSIEPHVSVVFHDLSKKQNGDPEEKAREQFESYVKYGRRLEQLVANCQRAIPDAAAASAV